MYVYIYIYIYIYVTSKIKLLSDGVVCNMVAANVVTCLYSKFCRTVNKYILYSIIVNTTGWLI